MATSRLERFQEKLGYRFSDVDLLGRCLTHVSFGRGEEDHNETLEFLGDAVLSLAVSHLLMRRHPERTEGDLSRMRASLVNGRMLAEKARRLDVGPVLKMGKGEERTGGRFKESILASAFEAVLGGIYWEAGYDSAKQVVAKHFREEVDEGPLAHDDYKTRLQEISQLIYQAPPIYTVVAESGPSHAKTFQTEISVGGDVLGRGEGRSKKQSEQEAARRALQRLQDQTSQ
jgi:ribonuclease III